MANKLYEESHIQNIANAIRGKNGLTDKYNVSEMAEAIAAISGGEQSGLVSVTGTTTSSTIDTTLSSIKYFVLYIASFNAVGLINAIYSDTDTCQYCYCNTYSDYLKTLGISGSKTPFSVNGGVFTWNGTGTAVLIDGKTYDWFAVGTA